MGQENEPREDAEVVRRCLGGETEAFGEIVGRYETRIYATVYRILGDAEDARDIAQEAFLRAYSKLDTFKEGARFSTWLYTIALNLTRSELRKRKARANRPTLSLNAVGGPGDSRAADPPARGEAPEETLGREELFRLALPRRPWAGRSSTAWPSARSRRWSRMPARWSFSVTCRTSRTRRWRWRSTAPSERSGRACTGRG
jgi:RNA polymerase sigma-70 factor (ECF subfamily)